MSKKKTREEFISEATKVHNGFYTYGSFVYVNAKTRGLVTCPIHGDFPQAPGKHISGQGCAKCSGKYAPTTEECVAEATQTHNGLYTYENFVYAGDGVKAFITCPLHGDFPQTPSSHKRGAGCDKCARIKNGEEKRDKAAREFVAEATKTHNGFYTYANFVYVNAKKQSFITCPLHGDFTQAPVNHKLGNGCKKCWGNRAGKANFDKAELEFFSAAVKKHNGFYTYGNFVYAGAGTKSFITCPLHGDFPQSPGSHKSGSGCPRCKGEKSGKLHFDEAAREFVAKATNRHDGFYTYENFVYAGTKTPSFITCPVHGDFLQEPSNHKSGKGCQGCGNNNYSKISTQWLEEIAQTENIFIQHAENQGEFRIPTTKFKVDGYCKETNTIYEFNGDCWHGNPELYAPTDKIHPFSKHKTAKQLYEATIAREEKIKSLGYNLVVIWESEYRNSHCKNTQNVIA